MKTPTDFEIFKDHENSLNTKDGKYVILVLNDTNSNDPFNFINNVKMNFPYVKSIFIPEEFYGIKIDKKQISNRIKDMEMLDKVDEETNSFIFNITPYMKSVNVSSQNIYSFFSLLF